MEWGLVLLVAVLASGLGFAGGQLAVVTDRRRRHAEARVPDAAFALEHVEDQTWSLVNVGRGNGGLVSVVPFTEGIETWPPRALPGQVESVVSEVLPTLAPGQSMSVWLSRYDRGQRVIVSWTSEDNVRRGPVTLELPDPG
ncbi:hypothetical protein [Microlunatus flavus]|uniref:Uncharacterized protein n=1 Tax=Microlunatus flavus TaxID=1036181 RepID=A0A1H9FY13_9ACTN|nr:hypothetical protein [Microlunatus flavus]SEQ42785.1 hypothetical protein SAMN05421756_103429 [Microlunatus flavus]